MQNYLPVLNPILLWIRLVLLLRRSETTVIGFMPRRYGSIPSLCPMITGISRRVDGGVAVIGAVPVLRGIWEHRSANPYLFTSQRDMLVAIGFGMAWIVVARVDAILVSIIRTGDPSLPYRFGP